MLKNRLAIDPTTWKAWYALPVLLAFLATSIIPAVGAMIAGEDETVTAALMPIQFIAFAALALAVIGLLARRFPSARDIGMRRTLGLREIGLIAVVFVVSHLLFWLLSLGGGQEAGAAGRHFEEMNLTGALFPAMMTIIASVILAPVCEELLYRAGIMRPIHDALARRGHATAGAVVSILVSSAAFALPHLGGSLFTAQAAAYMITGIAFGLVYLITGSMTAAMVAHSLQSCVAFGQIIIFGRGDAELSPLIYAVVFTCPIIVFLIARGLSMILPGDRFSAASTRGR